MDILKEKRELIILFSALVFAICSIFLWNKQSEAKREIKANLSKIELLEQDKKGLKDDLKASKKQIEDKDALLLVLSKNEKLLLSNLKNQKNEAKKNRFNYLNGTSDERFVVFSKLATEKSKP